MLRTAVYHLNGFARSCENKGAIKMKRYLVLALAAVALAIAAPSAFATKVIFDPPVPDASLPPPSSPFCTHNDPCSIGVLNHTYQLDFLPCGDVLGVNTGTNTWCLWMNNVTGHSAATFTFQFIVPDGGSVSGGDLQCSSIPTSLATNDCPSALPNPGELFTVSFFANPALSNRTDFYLFTD